MLLHKQDSPHIEQLVVSLNRRQCQSPIVSTTRASDMRQRVRVASCLAFVLLCRFPSVESCGESSVPPVTGDAAVHERAFQLDAQGEIL
jgi:hypothetical protein